MLSDADGYFNSGRYDLAFKKYEQILNLDPYNVAARRGQERIDLTKTRYGQEAYNETRARQLWQVQKGWEEPVRQYGQTVGPIGDAFARDAGGTARITNKLNSIVIPKIEFRDASIREAVDFCGNKRQPTILRLREKGGRHCPAHGFSRPHRGACSLPENAPRSRAHCRRRESSPPQCPRRLSPPSRPGRAHYHHTHIKFR